MIRQRVLINELKVPEIDECVMNNNSRNIFSVKLSEINGRVDASYHIPTVNFILTHMRKSVEEITTIGDPRISKKIILAGVFKRTYVSERYGYAFLGCKEITQLNPQTEKFLSRSMHKVRYEKELKVSENMILVSDRGTIGTVALVPKHWNGYAVSQNLLKVVPVSDEIAGYIYIYLNSELGRVLLRRQTYGSVVDMIDNNSLASVEIPILKRKDIQIEINSLALEANKKRYEAYEAEYEALRIMDEEVLYVK